MNHFVKTLHFYFNLVGSQLLFAPYTSNAVPCLRLGNPGAAWWIPNLDYNQHTTVYSGGVGNDISFELSLLEKYDLSVFAFDPTPAAITYIAQFKKNRRLHFFPWGLWSKNAKLKFFVPHRAGDVSHSIVNLQQTTAFFSAECKSIPSIMKELKHATIDLLKIDIEGAEYEVLETVLKSQHLPTTICVEFDQPTSLRKMWQMVMKLLAQGYTLVKRDYFNFTFTKL